MGKANFINNKGNFINMAEVERELVLRGKLTSAQWEPFVGEMAKVKTNIFL